ncbi:hypothetical protein T06_4583 [Trichinella sp. T6]|nr:hypothetical protein T06_4583 [Trichinella sp. T6]
MAIKYLTKCRLMMASKRFSMRIALRLNKLEVLDA